MENIDPNPESPLGAVVSDVPLPRGVSQRKLNSTAGILATMKPGDSIRLSRVEHAAIFSNAKTAKVKITTRSNDSQTFRAWRLPDEETA
jgi:hypothetical protein